MQVCGASAGVLQGGASGEALLSHLLSDISPPADALKVSEGAAPGPALSSGALAGASLLARRCLRVRRAGDLRLPPPPAAQPAGEPGWGAAGREAQRSQEAEAGYGGGHGPAQPPERGQQRQQRRVCGRAERWERCPRHRCGGGGRTGRAPAPEGSPGPSAGPAGSHAAPPVSLCCVLSRLGVGASPWSFRSPHVAAWRGLPLSRSGESVLRGPGGLPFGAHVFPGPPPSPNPRAHVCSVSPRLSHVVRAPCCPFRSGVVRRLGQVGRC